MVWGGSRILLERGQHRPVGMGHLEDTEPAGDEGPLRRLEVPGLSEEMAEAAEPRGRDPVPGGQRVVRERLAAVHERLVIVRGEPEAAPLPILESIE